MDTHHYQTRQQTHDELRNHVSGLRNLVSGLKTDNLELQIQVEEQRQEIQALKNQLRKAKAKSGLYKSVLGLTTPR